MRRPDKRQDTLQMNSAFKNILAVLAGVIAGSFVNIMLVNVGPSVIPLPEGADVSTMEKLRDSMALFTPANFLFPFLGHAVGTLAGAFVAAKLAASGYCGTAAVVPPRKTTRSVSLTQRARGVQTCINASPRLAQA
jgi:hypothetical protein